MAQADYYIAANPSGLNMRTEINTIFQAILSTNSGSSAPTVTTAFMLWVDTSNGTTHYLKMRNHTNDAWVSIASYNVATKTIKPTSLINVSTDNALVRFNGTTGEVQNSGVAVDDNDVFNKIIISKTSVTDGSLESNGNVFSGTYTPVITNVTNVTSSTAGFHQYMRVGDVVTVSGGMIVVSSTANTETIIRLSLPVSSNISALSRCAGSFGTSGGTTINNPVIYGDTTNNAAVFKYTPTANGITASLYFTFTYRIV